MFWGELVMRFPIDLNLFEQTKHTPTLPQLQQHVREMGSEDAKLYDYCIPVNPYFPTEAMKEEYHDRLESLLKYYPDGSQAAATIAGLMGVPADSIVVANGSTELITWIDHLYVKDSLATTIPTFGRWTDQPLETGKKLSTLQREESKSFRVEPDDFVRFVRDSRARVATICNPNNPTGVRFTQAELRYICRELNFLDLFIVDEAFIDFASMEPLDSLSLQQFAPRMNNVVVLKSLGKNFGLHGIRAGYAVTNSKLASHLRGMLPKWNLNAFVIALLEMLPANQAAYEASRIRTVQDRNYMGMRLKTISGLKVFPSEANFHYVKLEDSIGGTQLRNHLLTEYGILLRECGNKLGSSSQFFRIATRPEGETERLVQSLRDSIASLSDRLWPLAQ